MAQVVIDANIGAALVIDMPHSLATYRAITAWRESETTIVVPELWWYEVISTLRKAVVAKRLTSAHATAAIDALSAFEFLVKSTTVESRRASMRWAERLGQMVAYDAQYLALAENLGVDFWTGDERLFNRAQQLGVRWVKWIALHV